MYICIYVYQHPPAKQNNNRAMIPPCRLHCHAEVVETARACVSEMRSQHAARAAGKSPVGFFRLPGWLKKVEKGPNVFV